MQEKGIATDEARLGTGFGEKGKWHCHWTVKKYNDKSEITENDIPDEVVDFDGNVLCTTAINGMLNGLLGNALGFTAFNNANAWIAVGDGAATFGGAAAIPTVAATDTDLTSALEATTKTVSGAVSGTGSVVRLTVTAHGYGANSTYVNIFVTGVGGVAAANGYWTAFIVDANTLELQGTTFSGTYTSGGTTQRCNRARKPMQATFPSTPASGATQFQAQFGNNDANYTWDEFGIFNGNTGSGTTNTMLNHKGQGLGTKASSAVWTVTATITIS